MSNNPDLLVLRLPPEQRGYLQITGAAIVAVLVSYLVALLGVKLQRAGLDMTLVTTGIVVLLCLCGAAAGWRIHHRIRQELTKWQQTFSSIVEPEQARALLDKVCSQPPTPNWRLLTQALVQTPLRGKAIWLTRADELPEVAPLDIPIEPQRLNELRGVLTLRGERGPAAAPGRNTPWMRAMSRLPQDDRTLLGMGVGLVVLMVILNLMTGVWLVGFMMLLYGGLIALFLGLRLLVWHFGVEHLAVNAGLIERRARAGGWQLTLLTRPECVWLAAPLPKGAVQLHICHASGGMTTTHPADEALAILSAWLSPLPAPPPDRLEDLR